MTNLQLHPTRAFAILNQVITPPLSVLYPFLTISNRLESPHPDALTITEPKKKQLVEALVRLSRDPAILQGKRQVDRLIHEASIEYVGKRIRLGIAQGWDGEQILEDVLKKLDEIEHEVRWLESPPRTIPNC